MYSKSNILLFIAYMICTGLLIFSKRYDVQAESAARQAQTTVTVVTGNVELEQLESVERVISYETMKQRFCIDVSEKDLDTLMRIDQPGQEQTISQQCHRCSISEGKECGTVFTGIKWFHQSGEGIGGDERGGIQCSQGRRCVKRGAVLYGEETGRA